VTAKSAVEFHAYRIVRLGVLPFDGTGSFKYGGRWSSPGRYVIHAAETYSLAVLEILVHFNLGKLPPNLLFVRITIPASVSRESVLPTRLRGWRKPYPNGVSEVFGNSWYDRQRSSVLIVPSLLSPQERNLAIRQHHPDTRAIRVSAAKPVALDRRIKKIVSRRT
jgi:RES domain-containing protein